MDQLLKRYVPSNTFSYSQPIELRVQELIAGVRSDVGISLYGPDLDVLKEMGDEIVRVVGRVPGGADVRAQQIAGLPNVRIVVDRDAIARYDINASDVLDAVASIGGNVVGTGLRGPAAVPVAGPLRPRVPQEHGGAPADQDRRPDRPADPARAGGRPVDRGGPGRW